MRASSMRSLAAALLLGAVTVVHALEANEIFKRADPSIVVITTKDKAGKGIQGSGILIGPRDVVTSCHVLTDATRISVKQGDVTRSGTIRYQDSARDLCQVQIDDHFPDGKPASSFVKSADLEVGQSVYAISAPRGLERTISRGIVSGLRDQQDGSKLVQTDASISPGSSGGGLFDSEARLIGIITFGLVQENLNFAIPADWIEQLGVRNRDRLADAPPASTQPVAAAAASSGDDRWYPAKGDRWRYRLLDGKRPMGMVNIEVMEIGGGRVRERVTRDNSPGFSMEREVRAELSLDAFEPQVNLPGGYQLLDLSAYFPPETDLPRKLPGPVAGNVRIEQMGVRNVVWNVRLAGRDKVRVPAGEFESWGIEATANEVGPHGPVKIAYRVWYSQAMQRAVKMTLSIDFRVNAGKSSETLELAAFEKGI